MPNPVTTFDDGLTKYAFTYMTDAGVAIIASIRAGYIDDAVISAAPLPQGTQVNKPKALTLRHLVLTSVDGNNGRFLKRIVPCNKEDVATYFKAGQTTPSQVTVDGEVWNVTGFHGESWRGSKAPT